MIALEEWRSPGRTYRHRGHRVFYREAAGGGDGGPPLLLLHGYPTASWDWHRVWPQLADRHRLVAPDLLGFGFSAKPRAHEYSTFDQADLVEGLLGSLGIGEVHLLAHDYGDTVAQELLARRGERGPGAGVRLRSVAFLNGGLFPEANRPRPVQRLLLTPLGSLVARLYTRGAFARSFLPLFGPGTRPTPGELDAFWELVVRDGGRRVVHRIGRYLEERDEYRGRWVGAVRGTDVPTRLIVGADDPISGAHMADRWDDLVPGAAAVLLDGIGHYPQFETPGRVVREHRAFLRAAGDGPGPG